MTGNTRDEDSHPSLAREADMLASEKSTASIVEDRELFSPAMISNGSL